jgi:hypothetical protein
MKKVLPHTAPPSQESLPSRSAAGSAGDAPGAGPVAGGRRPYRRPEVTKRRSLSQATLVSGGGTPGTLGGGML